MLRERPAPASGERFDKKDWNALVGVTEFEDFLPPVAAAPPSVEVLPVPELLLLLPLAFGAEGVRGAEEFSGVTRPAALELLLRFEDGVRVLSDERIKEN